VVGVLSAATAVAGCDGKNNGDDDDDDDDNGGDSGSASGGKGGKGGNSGKGGTGGTSSIPAGSLGSPCDGASACDDGLQCYSNICIPDSSGTGGTASVEEGTLGGPCYPNDTCNATLTCLAGFCVPDSGSGTGGAGGSTGGGTSGGTGGSTGGGTSGGTGGSTGGGTSGGTGGSTGGSGATGGASSGGSGGTSGTGGTGGVAGGTASTLIVAEDGWVAEGSNTVGIVGPWYVFYDTESTIQPAGGTNFIGPDICVTGTVSKSDEYGPTVGLNLNQPDPDGDPLGYVPAEHAVTGFSFNIEGEQLPSSLQITLSAVDGSSYCGFLTPPGAVNTVSVTQAQLDCWNGAGTPAATTGSFDSIQFQLPVNHHADGQAFAFCLTNLRALTN